MSQSKVDPKKADSNEYKPNLSLVDNIIESRNTRIRVERNELKAKSRERLKAKSREKSRQLHSLSDVVDFFDGEWNQSEILLPIETPEPEKIILERAESVNNEYIRLIIPQIFGGVVNTFVLPDGINIHSVKWEQGKLKLFIED